jgi:copper(I)-binding protein
MKLRTLWVLTFFLVIACSGDKPPLIAEQLQIARPLPGMSMGAGYLTLKNNSGQQIRITEVHSAELKSVEMHESVLEDGVSRMYKLQEVVILPGQSVRFEPGAKHLMLRYRAMIPDQVTLQFYAEETLLLSVGATLED